MTTPTILWYRKSKPVRLPTYVGICCREWALAILVPVAPCGLCGQAPVFLRNER